jgi:hypothetical protein
MSKVVYWMSVSLDGFVEYLVDVRRTMMDEDYEIYMRGPLA